MDISPYDLWDFITEQTSVFHKNSADEFVDHSIPSLTNVVRKTDNLVKIDDNYIDYSLLKLLRSKGHIIKSINILEEKTDFKILNNFNYYKARVVIQNRSGVVCCINLFPAYIGYDEDTLHKLSIGVFNDVIIRFSLDKYKSQPKWIAVKDSVSTISVRGNSVDIEYLYIKDDELYQTAEYEKLLMEFADEKEDKDKWDFIGFDSEELDDLKKEAFGEDCIHEFEGWR